MVWQTALFLSIVVGTVRAFLYKKLVGRLDPFVITFFATLFGLPLYTIGSLLETGKLTFYPEMMVVGIGFLIAFNAYLFAVKINLSKSAVYGSYNMVIALFLSALFLSEWRYFDLNTYTGLKNILGILFAIISLMVMVRADRKQEKKRDVRWLIFIIIYIVLAGIGGFYSKLFLTDHKPFESLFPQILSILPAVYLVILIRQKRLAGYSKKSYIGLFLYALFDFLTVGLYYVALQAGPGVIVIPLQGSLLTVFVSMVGLILYNEYKDLNRGKLLSFFLGLTGALLLAL